MKKTINASDCTSIQTTGSLIKKKWNIAGAFRTSVFLMLLLTGSMNASALSIVSSALSKGGVNDITVTTLASPMNASCYTTTETVSVTVSNVGTQTINFSIDPLTINASVTGPNPVTFTPVTINTGTLAVGSTQVITVTTTYDMTAAGTYVFSASAAMASDIDLSNNTMSPATFATSAGTATSDFSSICSGSQVILSLAGNTGTIQWQSSTDGGLTWNNETGTGNTSATYVVTPTLSTMYQANVCGTMESNAVSVTVTSLSAPTTTGDTRCGTGIVNLSASGSNILQWYTAATGGTIVNTGSAYAPTLSATTTYYVENTTASPATHPTTLASGNGSSGNMFAITALNTITITGFDGHTSGGTSTWEIYYRPDNYTTVSGSTSSSTGWILLGTAANVTSNGTGIATPIPVVLNVTIPAGSTYSFHVVTVAGTGVHYTNGTAANNVYSSNGDLQFREGHGGTLFNCVNTPRVFNGAIHYNTGCVSPRTAVTATINPAPSITATSSAGPSICSGNTSAFDVTSTNANYSYMWSPSTGLSSTTGASVSANPSATTTYTVTASDASGCFITEVLPLEVKQSPVVSATAASSAVCVGSSVQLDVTNTTPSAVASIGTGTIVNDEFSYPTPYGNYYYGARHQFLITAAEMIAAGFTAGPINSLAFDVVALNVSQPLTDFEIKIGSTAVSALATYETGLTSVFTSPSYSPVVGLNTHPFTAPFTWNGTSNIVIETCFNNGSYLDNVSVNQSATSFASSLYYREDGTGVCANTSISGTSNQRPNITLSMANTYTHSWTPAATLDNASIANPMATPSAPTIYTVAVTGSLSGCTSSSAVTVGVNQLPAVLASSSSTVCAGSSTAITASGAVTYEWSPSADLSATTGTTVIAMPTATATYTVTGTDANNCSNTATATISVTTVDVTTTTTPAGVITANNAAGTYQWVDCNNNFQFITNETSQGYFPLANGDYAVIVTENGCSDTSACVNYTSVGIKGTAAGSNLFNLFPNPNTGTFTIQVSSAMKMEILNAIGQVVLNTTLDSGAKLVSMDNTESGLYFVTLVDQEGTRYTTRFVVTK